MRLVNFFCLPSESLVQLRAVDAEEPYFLLTAVNEEGEGIAVGNADNLAGDGLFGDVAGVETEQDREQQEKRCKTAREAERELSVHGEAVSGQLVRSLPGLSGRREGRKDTEKLSDIFPAMHGEVVRRYLP